jgi:hypothetical protein
MLRLFQKLLTDKELTPPDDWDPPIGYSRNTWGNIVHNKVCETSHFTVSNLTVSLRNAFSTV